MTAYPAVRNRIGAPADTVSRGQHVGTWIRSGVLRATGLALMRVAGRAAASAVMAAVPLALSAVPASATPHQASASTTPGAHKPLGTDRTPVLPAPPKPPAGLPKQPNGYQAPTALASGPARQAIVDARKGARLTAAASASAPATATATALVTPSQARIWGGSAPARPWSSTTPPAPGDGSVRCTPWRQATWPATSAR